MKIAGWDYREAMADCRRRDSWHGRLTWVGLTSSIERQTNGRSRRCRRPPPGRNPPGASDLWDRAAVVKRLGYSRFVQRGCTDRASPGTRRGGARFGSRRCRDWPAAALAASISSSVSFGGRPPGAAGAPRGGKARLRALADQAALEFRQRTKHVKDQPPLRGRRVEGFGQTAKPDTPHPQGFDGFDQLLHRPRQAVELPHNERVAAPREFERVM
jgi:hypothetical protein